MGEGVRKDVRKGKKKREERESADTEKERHTIDRTRPDRSSKLT